MKKDLLFSFLFSFSPFQRRLYTASVDPPWSTWRRDSCFPQRFATPSNCCRQWGEPIGKEGATILRGATHTGIPLTSGDLGRARDSLHLARALWRWGTETMGRYVGAIFREGAPEKELKMASDSLSRSLPGETLGFSFSSSLQRVDPKAQTKGQSSERIGDVSQVTVSQYQVSKQSSPSDSQSAL